MRPSLKAALAALLLVLSVAGEVQAQAGRNRQQAPAQKKKVEQPAPAPTDEQKTEEQKSEGQQAAPNSQDVETLKVETNLVTVPVIVSDRGNRYLPDLKREEFKILEDNIEQEISFFETVTAPFHVVLMLDTSGSTQDKLGQIQQAAISFTEQLQKDDRVKVISFDDRVRDLCDFTSDRAVLQWAIRDTRPGQGTKLYDAMATGLKALQRVKGRKAIVIFTDGVDSFSDRETYERNRRMVEEAGIIIYPIQYDTREDVLRLLRQQQQSGQIIDLATILGGRGGTTTPTTFPGGTNIPSGGGTGGRGTSTTLPGGVVLTRRDDRYPPDDPNDPNRDPNNPTTGSRPNNPSGRPDSIDALKAEIELLYRTAEAYLNEMADKSGGSLHRADTLASLPQAFKQIAAELRTQYSLGYYPKKTERDGKYRKIKVKTTRKDVSIRARPGYRAPGSL